MNVGVNRDGTMGNVVVSVMDDRRFAEWSEENQRKQLDREIARGADSEVARRGVRERFDKIFPDGHRTRGQHVLEVADESGPVGHAWLTMYRLSSGPEARICDVGIPEPEHRGTVLGACETYAERHGARCVHLNAPVESVPTFEQRGYGVTMFRLMRDYVASPPRDFPGAPTLRCETMDEDQRARLRTAIATDSALMRVQAGLLPPEESLARSGDLVEQLAGDRSDGRHHFLSFYDDDLEVGHMWLEIWQMADGVHAFANYLVVNEGLRHRLYARAVTVAMGKYLSERQVRDLGSAIYGPNLPARQLAEGHSDVTDVWMRKDL